ncbi:gas vesicle protein GvpG [Patescibacteria group bacterium]|nr:gas vesicle protein GvpG [Patescibacteria group bacterium]MBU4016266.1 gas vesicle protein GvpG [Patescibacteria group bacterium]MBU4099316.1 gas vesicle protein GvpG [Patescibacteria group bacterium]
MLFIDDLLFGLPAKGLVSIFKKITEMAEYELTDESKIKEDLLLLQTMYEIDQISEEEYQKKETVLLERLTAARESKSDKLKS